MWFVEWILSKFKDSTKQQVSDPNHKSVTTKSEAETASDEKLEILNDTIPIHDSPNNSGAKRNLRAPDDSEDKDFPVSKRLKRSATCPPTLPSDPGWWCKLLLHKDGRVIEV